VAPKAEALGVEIYPGFAAAEMLYDDNGAVRGIATGDMGIAKDGSHKDSYTGGMKLLGKYTLFAEGARGSLSKELIAKFALKGAAVAGSITAPSTHSRVRRPIARGNPTLKPRVGSQSQSCRISSLTLKAPIISMSGLSLRRHCVTVSSASCGNQNSRTASMTWPPPERWDPRRSLYQ
jgi:hypothetical protein